ncbi:MAG TPA: hypothetical protein VH143_25515 [Kofleriaceae bacterium]|nr:hypothetical protein [Kofleriaceae bacterium]
MVPLYAKGAIPSGGISGGIDTDDHSVAMLAPIYFNWSSNYPPQITITGIDDNSADSALRETGISGVVGDCGNGPVGSVYVVDRESSPGLDMIWLGTGSDSGLPPYYYVYMYVDP